MRRLTASWTGSAKQAGLPSLPMAIIPITAQIGRNGRDRPRGHRRRPWVKRRKRDWDNGWDARLNQQAMAVRNDVGGINTLQKPDHRGQSTPTSWIQNRRNMLRRAARRVQDFPDPTG